MPNFFKKFKNAHSNCSRVAAPKKSKKNSNKMRSRAQLKACRFPSSTLRVFTLLYQKRRFPSKTIRKITKRPRLTRPLHNGVRLRLYRRRFLSRKYQRLYSKKVARICFNFSRRGQFRLKFLRRKARTYRLMTVRHARIAISRRRKFAKRRIIRQVGQILKISSANLPTIDFNTYKQSWAFIRNARFARKRLSNKVKKKNISRRLRFFRAQFRYLRQANVDSSPYDKLKAIYKQKSTKKTLWRSWPLTKELLFIQRRYRVQRRLAKATRLPMGIKRVKTRLRPIYYLSMWPYAQRTDHISPVNTQSTYLRQAVSSPGKVAVKATRAFRRLRRARLRARWRYCALYRRNAGDPLKHTKLSALRLSSRTFLKLLKSPRGRRLLAHRKQHQQLLFTRALRASVSTRRRLHRACRKALRQELLRLKPWILRNRRRRQHRKRLRGLRRSFRSRVFSLRRTYSKRRRRIVTRWPLDTSHAWSRDLMIRCTKKSPGLFSPFASERHTKLYRRLWRFRYLRTPLAGVLQNPAKLRFGFKRRLDRKLRRWYLRRRTWYLRRQKYYPSAYKHNRGKQIAYHSQRTTSKRCSALLSYETNVTSQINLLSMPIKSSTPSLAVVSRYTKMNVFSTRSMQQQRRFEKVILGRYRIYLQQRQLFSKKRTARQLNRYLFKALIARFTANKRRRVVRRKISSYKNRRISDVISDVLSSLT